ncbi:54S ribosomal protein L37 [Yarrowia sp. C11]|nr:54S ribosomal protein L37 [Yarrowia sp. C11]KAG5364078.1 54S ribosomal protein L37 [Yarrowia sp. E02]
MLRLLTRSRAAPLRVISRAYSTPSQPKTPSSVAAGTVLKGCNVRKNGQDPVALEDSEYPQWLWDILDPAAQKAKLEADPVRAARKAQKARAKAKLQDNNFVSKMNK